MTINNLKLKLMSLVLSAAICISSSSCSLMDSSSQVDSKSANTSSTLDTSSINDDIFSSSDSSTTNTTPESSASSESSSNKSDSTVVAPQTTTQINTSTTKATTTVQKRFDVSQIPTYSGAAYVAINGNIPFFSASDMTTKAYETYSPLDNLGRCGVAISCIGKELMPTEPRGSIGMIKPSGWHLVKYQGVEGNYLYNRCHLIGYQLTGENANEHNLVTGTRYMNVQGMEPLENKTANYINSTGNHVIYRSTPIFIGSDLLCRGVLMEGKSVEDNGAGLTFCVFAYNVQPGITINYADGSSSGPEYIETQATTKATTAKTTTNNFTPQPSSSYVLNKNTHKFHYPSCSSVSKMAEKNKVYFNGTRDQVISQGYSPCNRCNP